MAKYVVTGGAGAIGSNLVNVLVQEGHEVTVIDDLSSGHQNLLPEKANFINGSVADRGLVENLLNQQPDYVVHMAALFANQMSVDHPHQDLLVNGSGTLNVFDAAAKAGIKKVLYVSSSCVYGNKELMSESDIGHELDTPYAITKLLGEQYASFYAHNYDLDVVSVRLFNTYGPNEYPGRYRNVIPNWMHKARRNEPLIITGTGAERRDFTFVKDTVCGLLKVLHGGTNKGDVFNIASGKSTSIAELAEMINLITGNTAGVEFVARRSWDHIVTRQANISKAMNEVGYVPKTNLYDGLLATYLWHKDHVDIAL